MPTVLKTLPFRIAAIAEAHGQLSGMAAPERYVSVTLVPDETQLADVDGAGGKVAGSVTVHLKPAAVAALGLRHDEPIAVRLIRP